MASTELLGEPRLAFSRRTGRHLQIANIEFDVIYGPYAISSSASGWYGHKRRPGRLLSAGRLTHHRKRACRWYKPRKARRGHGSPRAQKALGENGFVHISQCSFEFRFSSGITGSWKNRSNLMQIINFHLGASIIGTSGHFVVSLEAPSIYDWARHNRPIFNNLTYVECPQRVKIGHRTIPHKAIRGGVLPYPVIYYVLTAGRLDNRCERYNRDFLMPTTA